MKQTPLHDVSNPDLLALVPKDARKIVEIGCSSGALARDYKSINPHCYYIGCDIDVEYVELAGRYCDSVQVVDIDAASDEFFQACSRADVWVFGDALEHLKDPWSVLARVCASMEDGGCVVACIPNAQHWSVLARLAVGEFRYEDSGLLDRTHLRWFTRKTIVDLFLSSGFYVEEFRSRVFDEPSYSSIAPIIEELAEVSGFDPLEAADDARALQYLVLARKNS